MATLLAALGLVFYVGGLGLNWIENAFTYRVWFERPSWYRTPLAQSGLGFVQLVSSFGGLVLLAVSFSWKLGLSLLLLRQVLNRIEVNRYLRQSIRSSIDSLRKENYTGQEVDVRAIATVISYVKTAGFADSTTLEHVESYVGPFLIANPVLTRGAIRQDILTWFSFTSSIICFSSTLFPLYGMGFPDAAYWVSLGSGALSLYYM